MDNKRGLLAKLLFLVAFLSSSAISTTASAGPLLDWLFYRNRSQGLNNRPGCAFGSCLFNNNRRAPGYGNYGAAGSDRPSANSNPYAANGYPPAPTANQYASSSGYAPESGCGPGWCQETVVRYVPQVAYRTMYQPVPVTTYKTSTSINPATGLPRTCTRPCTSYSYQARRVPYTTYRPVYTTVPVADNWGGNSSYTAQASGYAPTYAYQPPNQSGCVGCQNSATGGYSNWSNIPGYTPGNAALLPPSSRSAPPSRSSWGTSSDYARATPWRSESSATRWTQEPEYSGRDYESEGYSGGGYTATPWRGESEQDYGEAANERPRLRPSYPDEYGESTVRPLPPKPMTEEMRRRMDREINGEESTSRYDTRRENYASARDPDFFRTPREQGFVPSPVRPSSSGYDTSSEADDTYRGGIRALDPPRSSSEWNFSDKTAYESRNRMRGKTRRGGEMPRIEENTRTRYAAAPINWSRSADEVARDRRSVQLRTGYRRSVPSSRQDNDWTPVR